MLHSPFLSNKSRCLFPFSLFISSAALTTTPRESILGIIIPSRRIVREQSLHLSTIDFAPFRHAPIYVLVYTHIYTWNTDAKGRIFFADHPCFIKLELCRPSIAVFSDDLVRSRIGKEATLRPLFEKEKSIPLGNVLEESNFSFSKLFSNFFPFFFFSPRCRFGFLLSHPQ